MGEADNQETAIKRLQIPKSVDITGITIPSIKGLLGSEEKKAFLDERRVELLKRVIENVNQRTVQYRLKPIRFRSWQIGVINDPENPNAGTCNQKTNYIIFNAGRLDQSSEADFVRLAAHEYYHTRERNVFGGRKHERRSLSMGRKDLRWIEEGIVELSAWETARELGFRDFTIKENDFYQDSVGYIMSICQKIVINGRTKEGKDPTISEEELRRKAKEVFLLFEQAIYGRGEILPLARAINDCYKEEGGFKEFIAKCIEMSRLTEKIKLARESKDSKVTAILKESYQERKEAFSDFVFAPEERQHVVIV